MNILYEVFILQYLTGFWDFYLSLDHTQDQPLDSEAQSKNNYETFIKNL